jgi:hypothetical protein
MAPANLCSDFCVLSPVIFALEKQYLSEDLFIYALVLLEALLDVIPSPPGCTMLCIRGRLAFSLADLLLSKYDPSTQRKSFSSH